MVSMELQDVPPEQFKEFVLYVIPGEENSEKALALAGGNVHIQDVRTIRKRPAWLVGVPTVVHREESNAYRGSAALELLRSDQVTEPGAPAGVHDTWAPPRDPGDEGDVDNGKLTHADMKAYMRARDAVVAA